MEITTPDRVKAALTQRSIAIGQLKKALAALDQRSCFSADINTAQMAAACAQDALLELHEAVGLDNYVHVGREQ